MFCAILCRYLDGRILKLEYELIRSTRRTIGLSLNRDGRLTVRAPRQLSEAAIGKIIERHRRWIVRKRQELANAAEWQSPFRPEPGCRLPLLDERFEVRLSGTAAAAYRDNVFLVPFSRHGRLAEELVRFYRQKAADYLPERTAMLAERHRVGYARVRISNARRRWGSCSSNGNINLSWRLMLCPARIVDHIILHELAHRTEMNHSVRFRQLIARYDPDYAAAQHWLKQYGPAVGDWLTSTESPSGHAENYHENTGDLKR